MCTRATGALQPYPADSLNVLLYLLSDQNGQVEDCRKLYIEQMDRGNTSKRAAEGSRVGGNRGCDGFQIEVNGKYRPKLPQRFQRVDKISET